jgi:hypothetical protein
MKMLLTWRGIELLQGRASRVELHVATVVVTERPARETDQHPNTRCLVGMFPAAVLRIELIVCK